MKAMALTLPLVVVSLIFVFVWAIGMLTVRSSAIATQGSLELLRLHVEVARLHDTLLENSQRNLSGSLQDFSALAEDGKEEMPVPGSVRTRPPASDVVTARHAAAAPWPGPALVPPG